MNGFPLASLPPDVREDLARVAASEAATSGRLEALSLAIDAEASRRAGDASRTSGLAVFPGLPEHKRRRAEARAAVVASCREFVRTSGSGLKRGRELYCHAYNTGAIAVEPFVHELLPTVCSNSLARWENQLAQQGLARLAGLHGRHRKGKGKIGANPQLREFVSAMLTDFPHADATSVMAGIKARFGRETAPNLRTLQRYISAWKTEHEQAYASITNPDAWRSRYQSASGSALGCSRLNERWEADGTKADIMLADGQRHTIVGVVDVYSRRLKFLVSRSSSSAAVASLLRLAMLEWGMPEWLRTDNGSDFVSQYITRVVLGLDILHEKAPPFTPEFKPYIERHFQTFLHGIFELLPGFVGHNVAERKDIEARKSFAQRMMDKDQRVEIRMTPEDLQKFCDRWCEDVYQHTTHGGEGMNGATPWEKAASWTGQVRRIEDERALDVLLAPAPGGDGRRQVAKKGIRIDRSWYTHPLLGGLEGKRLPVLLDEADIGRIYIFDEDGGFVCAAVCPEIAGVSRRELALARRAHQKKAIAEQKAKLRAIAKRADTKNIVGEIMAAKAAEASEMPKISHPATIHATNALREAGTASRASRTPAPTADLAAARAVAERSMAGKVVAMPESPESRYRRWKAVNAAITAGESVPENDRKWWGLYQKSSEFSGQALLEGIMAAQGGMKG